MPFPDGRTNPIPNISLNGQVFTVVDIRLPNVIGQLDSNGQNIVIQTVRNFVTEVEQHGNDDAYLRSITLLQPGQTDPHGYQKKHLLDKLS